MDDQAAYRAAAEGAALFDDSTRGKIAVAVAREKVKPGDEIEVRTPNAVAGVRGTVFVAEVSRATASARAAQE